ncbi:MAG TPA: 2-oxoglutarate and iron-dependent oxygenase domain-containing protein [Nitrospira sp.]|nr:2-oxoglutarate and iron-dependent oxygenase domain-containing protein [Nitrospira sp.]
MPAKRVPVIDIQHLGSWGSRHDETITAIGGACHEYGFFQITGHGISSDLIEQVWCETKRFFALPLDAKQAVSRSKENARGWYNRELTKNTRDMKEVFDFGTSPNPDLSDDDPANWTQDGFNRWPDVHLCPRFRPVMQEYFRACERVAFTLLKAIAKSLGVPPEMLTHDFVGPHTSFIRLNHYPRHDPLCPEQPASATGHLGVHQHTDAGALTLLLQDDVSALEISVDGQWILVEPVISALVVNIGDIVQVWSNDRYPAPLHRVRASTNRERYSLPFFFNPVSDADYAPLAALTNEESPPRYWPINWGNFRYKRQQGDYADYGAENQISDYRIPGVGAVGP